MPWQQLEISTTATEAESIADQLLELGALAVSFKDAADEPLFQEVLNETPLWTKTIVVALFAEDTNLHNTLPHLHPKITEIQDQDWVATTQRSFTPRCFGQHLWVIPSWYETGEYGPTVIRLDPGLAFGTGTHATTALCLEWLANHPPRDQMVLDFGCGSGILALAARALGAKKVFAVDHDPQALEATTHNAALNAFTEQSIEILYAAALPALPFPLIMANILAKPLIELAPFFLQRTTPATTLILSGILTNEMDSVIQAYAKDFTVTTKNMDGEWVQLTLKRK